jgi:hypothetical protein
MENTWAIKFNGGGKISGKFIGVDNKGYTCLTKSAKKVKLFNSEAEAHEFADKNARFWGDIEWTRYTVAPLYSLINS